MDVAHDVWPAKDEYLATSLFAPVIVEGEMARLDLRAHCAVVDDDAVFYGLQVT
jgi:hypothetical protein